MQLFSIVDNRRHRVIDRVEARSHDEALDKYATSIGVSLMEIESDCEHSHVSVAPSLTVVTARRLMTTMLWPGKYLVFEGGRRIKTREIEAPQLCDVDYVVRHLDHGARRRRRPRFAGGCSTASLVSAASGGPRSSETR